MTLARTNALRLFIALFGLTNLAAQTKIAVIALLGKLARLHSSAHRTSRLRFMSAIAESTLFGELLHIDECGLDARIGIPQGKTAHARHINNAASTRNRNHFARNRRVATLAIALANGARCLHIASDQQVHQARFADAAFSQQHGDAAFRNRARTPSTLWRSSAETTKTGVPWAIFSTKSRA